MLRMSAQHHRTSSSGRQLRPSQRQADPDMVFFSSFRSNCGALDEGLSTPDRKDGKRKRVGKSGHGLTPKARKCASGEGSSIAATSILGGSASTEGGEEQVCSAAAGSWGLSPRSGPCSPVPTEDRCLVDGKKLDEVGCEKARAGSEACDDVTSHDRDSAWTDGPSMMSNDVDVHTKSADADDRGGQYVSHVAKFDGGKGGDGRNNSSATEVDEARNEQVAATSLHEISEKDRVAWTAETADRIDVKGMEAEASAELSVAPSQVVAALTSAVSSVAGHEVAASIGESLEIPNESIMWSAAKPAREKEAVLAAGSAATSAAETTELMHVHQSASTPGLFVAFPNSKVEGICAVPSVGAESFVVGKGVGGNNEIDAAARKTWESVAWMSEEEEVML